MSNTLKLYSIFPIDRSVRVSWMLRELDLPFEQIWIDTKTGEHRKAPFLALNPMGTVPVLEFNDLVLTDSSAILCELARRFPNTQMIPDEGTEQARHFWQWLFWGASTLDPAAFALMTALCENPDGTENSDTVSKVERFLCPLDDHLADNAFLCAEQFTVADIITAHCLILLGRRYRLSHHGHVSNYLSRLGARPAAAQFYEAAAELPIAA